MIVINAIAVTRGGHTPLHHIAGDATESITLLPVISLACSPVSPICDR